jgi:transmembrane sensor
MDDNKIFETIAKVLSGEASNTDQQMVEDWKNASDQNKVLFDAIDHSWSDTRTKFFLGRNEKDAAYQKIMVQAQGNLPASSYVKVVKPRFTSFKIAAAITFFIVATFLGYWVVNDFNKVQTQAQAIDVATITKSVNKGQKLKIHLPDGSFVWLNSESSISYPDRFTGPERVVELSGEAFFEVVKNSDQPFVVHAGELSTHVMGTTFNVRNFENEDHIDVALLTGMVKVNSGNHSEGHVLNPGEKLSYSIGKKEYKMQPFDELEEMGWKDGILFFNNASYEDVVNTLERWYGVEFITVKKDTSPWKFSGEFRNEYLDIVLKSISYSKNFTYIIDQNKVYIKF